MRITLPALAAALSITLAVHPARGQIASGSYTGTGVNQNINDVGFAPVAVIVKGDVSQPAVIRTRTMPAQLAKSLADSPTPAPDRIQNLLGSGFALGSDPTVNALDGAYDWIAWEEIPGHIVADSYVGDGTNSQVISGHGFQPAWLLILPENNQHATHKTAAMPGDTSRELRGEALRNGRILSLDPDGFSVGNDNHTNDAGIVYHYLALSSEIVETGSYTGNGSFQLMAVSREPQWVLVSSAESVEAVHRPLSMIGPLSHHFIGSQVLTGAISGIGTTWFTIGDADQVNKVGDAYFYTAMSKLPADLGVLKSVSDVVPRELDVIEYTVIVGNAGPYSYPDVELNDMLPAGVTYQSHTTTDGVYTPQTGIWSISLMNVSSLDTLSIFATVDDGTAGQTITNVASVTSKTRTDTNSDNDTGSAAILVQQGLPSGADTELAKVVNNAFPSEGDAVTFTVNVTNNGPLNATGVTVMDSLPAGLTYVSHTASVGTYDTGSGLWDIDNLDADAGATLTLTAEVDAGTGGSTLTNLANLKGQTQLDHEAANNSDSASVTVQLPTADEILVELAELEAQTLLPGAPRVDVAILRLVNETSSTQSLNAITFSNEAVGPGSEAEMDASWGEMNLVIRTGTVDQSPGEVSELPRGTAMFQGGAVTFAGLNVGISANDTLTVVLKGNASLAARDGDVLRVGLSAPSSLVFGNPVSATADWPLIPDSGFTVDGMSAAALSVEAVEAMVFEAGSTRNVALHVVVPPNGYVEDEIQRIDVIVAGSATYPDDIAAMEIFADTGDGVFSADTDVALGPLSYTGARWERTGLSVPVPLEGARLFITVDIAEAATQGATLRLGLPAAPDVSLGMASDNDGPVDEPVQNPFAQTISVPDRIILGATDVGPGVVSPGAADVDMLGILATNTYADARVLTSLTLTNTTVGDPSATTADLDGELATLVLRIDGNNNGTLDDIETDPIAATTTFEDGEARFSGVSWDLPSGMTRSLFVTSDVAERATDGDVLSLQLDGPQSVAFETPAAVVAVWPIDSDARWTVDGMVAAQLVVNDVPPAVLAAGDQSTLVLDLVVPRNGYLDDELQGVELVNLGSATSTDFDDVHLWRDGGNGVFDPAGDDADLGSLTWFGGFWRSALLSESLQADGARLYVAVDVAGAPTDSATVRLAVPVGGVTVASTNDGPIDVAVAGANTQLLSGSPLVATLTFVAQQSTLGQSVTATMLVRNAGSEDIVDVAPSALSMSGSGELTLTSGPVPATQDLSPDDTGVFVWTFDATDVGDVRLTGSASGTGMPSTIARASLQTNSDLHNVLVPVSVTDLFAVENMPFAIGLGETNVVPFTLTFVNPGGPDASYVKLSSLRVRLEDETGAGIVPDDQLARVVVSEGGNVYLEKTSLETTGAEIDLTLDTPVVIAAGDPVTLSLRIDIALDASSPTFRVSIDDSTWFAATDAIEGGGVSVHLANGTFPIESGLGRLVTEADLLNVSSVALTPVSVGPGEPAIPLMSLDLFNPSGGDVSADVVVGSFSVSLLDTLGVAVDDPGHFIQSIRAKSGVQTLFTWAPSEGDTVIAFSFSPPVTVPVDVPVPILIEGDIATELAAGSVRLRLRGTGEFEAWDETSGDPVIVVYETPIIDGCLVTTQLEATTMMASGVPTLAETVPIGAGGVPAMTAILRHPGGSGVAPARVDSLSVRLVDGARSPLDSDDVLDALHLFRNGTEIAVVGGPFGPSGTVVVPLTGVLIDPAQVDSFDVVLDFEADAPTTSFELMIEADGIRAVDANLGTSLSIQPEDGESFPISSGLGRLEPPADELIVGFTDHFPAVLAGTEAWVHVADMTLTNTAGSEAGDIEVERLIVRAADKALAPLAAGAGVTDVALRAGTTDIAGVSLAATDSVATLDLADPLSIPSGQSVTLSVYATFRSDSPASSYRMGLGGADVVVKQPESGLISVRVEPEPGDAFPYWTAVGNFTELDLAESYSNFPNPFAAGRESTTFVFALDAAGTVSLRLLGPRGERVATLLDAESFPPGLHQSNRWDGRNGRGRVVRNGVYIAELVVRFDDGREARHRRKVAVIR